MYTVVIGKKKKKTQSSDHTAVSSAGHQILKRVLHVKTWVHQTTSDDLHHIKQWSCSCLPHRFLSCWSFVTDARRLMCSLNSKHELYIQHV
jgi:hypothetical protein